MSIRDSKDGANFIALSGLGEATSSNSPTRLLGPERNGADERPPFAASRHRLLVGRQ